MSSISQRAIEAIEYSDTDELIRVIDGETFYRICYALLFFAGVKLIYDGLLGKGLI